MILLQQTAVGAKGQPVPASAPPATNASRACLSSPDQALTVCVSVADGHAYYQLSRRHELVVLRSELGLDLQGEISTADRITRVVRGSTDTHWEQPWGEQRVIRDRHNEMRVSFGSSGGTPAYDAIFRLFDDGLGFRYDYEGLAAGQPVAVMDERTEFRFGGSWKAWWQEANGTENLEHLYSHGPLDGVGSAETPFTIERHGLYVSVHEAALVDFAKFTLEHCGPQAFRAHLYRWSDGVAVRRTGPFTTPWRTILVGTTPGALADSRIELNLNEPNSLGDVKWVKPMKYVGVWWEMHLGKATWSSGPHHGATTANVKRYMDFAAKYGFGGVLVEGWNKGWDGDWTSHGEEFSFTESAADFDLAAVTAYARSKGVELIGHHETAGMTENYGRQVDAAMDLYRRYGVPAVKTGYVRKGHQYPRTLADGSIGNEWYGGQYMVNFHQKVTEAAARHRLAIDEHEPVPDTGLRRTWPNLLSREGQRGQEYNAWGTPTNPPAHVTILPFTRMLAGPFDYTPGIFDIEHGKVEVNRRVQSTLAQQLALYVLIYSPVQMAADLPENYEARLDAFQFIRDVPVDWEQTRTLPSVIGEYAVVARQERGGTGWFLGAATNEDGRTVTVPLDFLESGMRYEATMYLDGDDADYRTNPTGYKIAHRTVMSRDLLTLKLAPGGGAAVRFRKLD